MTRTLLISSFFCSALMIGCGDGKGEATTNTTKTGETGETDDDGGSVTTTGAVNPSASSDPDTGDNMTNPTTMPEPAETTNVMTNPGSATDPMTTGPEETGCGFICDTTGGNTTIALCDVFKQDCPEGEKCTAYAEGGGSSWNATKCVPVTGEGVPGDACMAEGGGVSGLDNCQKGSMCWDVNAENKGLCVELCGGSEAAPTCSDEADFNCAVVNEGVLNLCLPGCDPLMQDCPGDDLCIPLNDTFVCVLDASGDEGKEFDPCAFANACDKGLVCLDPILGMECDPNAEGCCLPFCDLGDPNVTCPGQGQKCTSIYQEGMAPPEFEKVGWCVIPA